MPCTSVARRRRGGRAGALGKFCAGRAGRVRYRNGALGCAGRAGPLAAPAAPQRRPRRDLAAPSRAGIWLRRQKGVLLAPAKGGFACAGTAGRAVAPAAAPGAGTAPARKRGGAQGALNHKPYHHDETKSNSFVPPLPRAAPATQPGRRVVRRRGPSEGRQRTVRGPSRHCPHCPHGTQCLRAPRPRGQRSRECPRAATAVPRAGPRPCKRICPRRRGRK